jgi:hypothetical protein
MNNRSIRIARFLRRFFTVARVLTIAAGVFFIFFFLGSFIRANKPNAPAMPMPLILDLAFKSKKNAISLHSGDIEERGDISIRRFSAKAVLHTSIDNQPLVNRVRWMNLPFLVFAFALSFVLTGLLRKLCQNIENGEMFTDQNFRFLRNIGLVLIAGDIIYNTLVVSFHYVVVRYIAEHMTLTGIDGAVQSNWFTSLIFSGVITGLLVFLFAEAFRQGLTLKQENELTV